MEKVVWVDNTPVVYMTSRQIAELFGGIHGTNSNNIRR